MTTRGRLTATLFFIFALLFLGSGQALAVDTISSDIVTKGPWIDIRAFGAHSITEPGYSSFDSTSAIQAAIDAAGPGTVLVPIGRFLHTGLSVVNPVQIVGLGWDYYGSVLQNTSLTNPGISIVNPSMTGARDRKSVV